MNKIRIIYVALIISQLTALFIAYLCFSCLINDHKNKTLEKNLYSNTIEDINYKKNEYKE